MDRVVPVVIVVGVHSIPAAIMRLQRVMRPSNAGIGARQNNSLPGESQRPHLGCVRVIDARFDRIRVLKIRRRLNGSRRLRKMILNERIAFYMRHIRPGSQRFGHRAAAFH